MSREFMRRADRPSFAELGEEVVGRLRERVLDFLSVHLDLVKNVVINKTAIKQLWR